MSRLPRRSGREVLAEMLQDAGHAVRQVVGYSSRDVDAALEHLDAAFSQLPEPVLSPRETFANPYPGRSTK